MIGFGSGSFSIVLSVSLTVCCMCSVQCSYSGFPGRAWYRSRKYSLMFFFFSSSGFFSLIPSSLIVSYSSFWPLLSILLLCFQNPLRFILLVRHAENYSAGLFLSLFTHITCHPIHYVL